MSLCMALWLPPAWHALTWLDGSLSRLRESVLFYKLAQFDRNFPLFLLARAGGGFLNP
jgi:hypothetical protein